MNEHFNRIVKGYEIFCQILLLLMSALVIIFVFLRYSLNITFVWGEELITMLFISTTYFGAVLGMKYNEHINIGFIHEYLSPRIKRYVDIFNFMVILVLQIAIVQNSLDWIAKVGNIPSVGLRVPMRYFYYMMPLSSVLIGCFCIVKLIALIFGGLPDKPGHTPETTGGET